MLDFASVTKYLLVSVPVILFFTIIVVVLVRYMSCNKKEGLSTEEPMMEDTTTREPMMEDTTTISPYTMESTPIDNPDYETAFDDGLQIQTLEVTPEDLLPSDEALNEFDNEVGSVPRDDVNYLIAGQQQGLNTIGSSKKNSSWDLRSAPYIPKQDVLWNNSSYTSDALPGARQVEIGSTCM